MADTISTFATGNVQDNEIVKAADFQFAFESLVDNFSKFGRMVLESRQNFVIGGEVYKENGMNLRVKPIYGVNHNTSVPFGCVTDSPINVSGAIEYITLAHGGDADRIDAIGVRGVWKEYDEQQRSFRDFDTETDTIQNTNVKKTLALEYEVFKGDEGSAVAPDVDSGWVKLCEVFVPANSIEIEEENIHNITTDIAGDENEEWTSQKDETYNIGFISDVNERFRQQHNVDGSHKEDIIGTDELRIGTSAKEVNASVLPVASEITVGLDKKGSSASVTALLSLCASYITSLFNSYKKNGDYAFNGEVSVSDLVDEDNSQLLDAFVFGTEGEDDERFSYIKYGDKQIVKILPNGTIRGSVDYEATNEFDLVNKAITDALAEKIRLLTERVKVLEDNVDPSISVNRAFNKFSKYTGSTVISCATTENIELSGIQIIDGYALNELDYVLVKDQDDKKENGIYRVLSSKWVRAEFTQSREDGGPLAKTLFIINGGSTNKNKEFYTSKDSFTTDEDEFEWLENRVSEIVFNDDLVTERNGWSAKKINEMLGLLIPTERGELILNAAKGESGTLEIKQSGFYHIQMVGGHGGNGGAGGLGSNTAAVGYPYGGLGGGGESKQEIVFLLPGIYNYIVGGDGGNGANGGGSYLTANTGGGGGGGGGAGGNSAFYSADGLILSALGGAGGGGGGGNGCYNSGTNPSGGAGGGGATSPSSSGFAGTSAPNGVGGAGGTGGTGYSNEKLLTSNMAWKVHGAADNANTTTKGNGGSGGSIAAVIKGGDGSAASNSAVTAKGSIKIWKLI